MSQHDFRFWRWSHFLALVVALAFAALLLIPLSAAAKGGGEISQPITSPIWNIFRGRTGKSVHWRIWKPNKRFAIYDNGTPHFVNDDAVLDRETRLVWERYPQHRIDPMPWGPATMICKDTQRGGRKGWHMPSAEEFGSLIDPTQPIGSTALPSGHPFEGLLVNGERYWSSTTVWFDFPNVAVVFPLDTEETTIQSKDDLNWTWCVRGGNQMDTGLNMP